MKPGRPSLIDQQLPTEDMLVEAVRQLGVRGVADRLNVSPSAVSRRLKHYGLRAVTITEIVERAESQLLLPA